MLLDLLAWRELVMPRPEILYWRTAGGVEGDVWTIPGQLSAFHGPFAGGGALPLEAQRMGLEAYACDLNPVAVLMNKAMIEIPTLFVGQPPVNP